MNERNVSGKGKNLLQVQQHNRCQVLKVITDCNPISRAEIARVTELSPQTISNIVSDLAETAFIREIGAGEFSTPGRKPILLELNESAYYVVGVDLERAKMEELTWIS